MRICTFYTDDPLYRGHYEAWQESVDQWAPDAEVIVRKVPPKAKWVQACAYKARFCYEVMQGATERTLWVDVDGRLRAPLDPLFTYGKAFDIGAHYRQPRVNRPRKELLSGTLLFNPTEMCERALTMWVQLCDKYPTQWDQKMLRLAVERTLAKVWPLGPEWTYVFDIFKKWHPGVVPKIEHLQASRKATNR